MSTDHKAGIYWLASYPKSGNTWFRIVLANFFAQNPIQINQFSTGKIASDRSWVEDALGFDSTYLTHDELDKLRSRVYAWLGESTSEPVYHKIHDAYILIDGEPLLPKVGCLGALYFIRNPLDVAVSYAHHTSKSIDEIIFQMSQPDAAFCKSSSLRNPQIRQQLLSWSMHAKSWIDNANIPICTVRYEDMHGTPHETFMQAFQFLGLTPSAKALTAALENARIDKLQAQENKEVFREKPSQMKRFFRKGIVGDWQNTLTEAQISRIIQEHRQIMERFNYLNADSTPKL